MGEQSFSKTDDDKSIATGVDTGSTAPGGEIQTGAKPNPQTEENRSFQAGQGEAKAAKGSDERIDTDGDGRKRDPDDTRPTDNGGQGAPVQR